LLPAFCRASGNGRAIDKLTRHEAARIALLDIMHLETPMIRTLLTSTALAMLLATGAMAQNATTNANSDDLLTKGYDIVDTDGLASRLIGFPVYASAANDAERYGEINDLVIGQDGQVAAVIVGVGGFLGVGEKNVAVDYNDLQWTTAEDKTERLVLETTKEALNSAPAVEMTDDAPMDTAAVPAADQPAATTPAPASDTAMAPANDANSPADNTMAPANNDTAMAPATPADDDAVDTTETGAVNNQTAAAPDATTTMDPFDPAKSTTVVDVSTLTADDLKGINVYGPDNQHIGTIGDLVLGEDGKMVDAIIVDFGGFLGIGTKPVAIAYDRLPFFADDAGNRSLVLNLTREQMEAAPAFNKDTYAAERDSQRLMVTAAS
jgi:sporulation protein YlmC with PRC-barrel domain